MKILCLFVRHGTSAYPEALSQLDAWYERHGLRASRTLWIIDNALPVNTAPMPLAPDVLLRSGDNAAWEFSAWDRVRQECRPESGLLLHFVTSAFNTLYTGYLEHFHPMMLEYVAKYNTALGHIDCYDRPVALAGHMSASWIRTCFFFMRAEAALSLPPWASFTNPSMLFESPGSTRFRHDAPLSEDYRKHISTWLKGHVMGGYSWHSPVGSGPTEIARFQRKSLAILNEHHLAIKLRSAGIHPVDFCWLHDQMRRHTASAPPTEAEQLKERSRLLGITDIGR